MGGGGGGDGGADYELYENDITVNLDMTDNCTTDFSI